MNHELTSMSGRLNSEGDVYFLKILQGHGMDRVSYSGVHWEGFGPPTLANHGCVGLFFGFLKLCWAYVGRCWLGRV